MRHGKHSKEGHGERLDLLQRFFTSSRAILTAALDKYPRKYVAKDDILDALAIAVSYFRASGHFISLPWEPETDAAGLPMRIVYADPKSISS